MPDLTIDPARLTAVVAALDASDQATGIARGDALMLRVGKVAEEYGEAWAALIGMHGQNPRKGRTHTEDDVVGELLDVALTALVAAASRPEARRFHPLRCDLTRPVELWRGMRRLGWRVGCLFLEESDDPVRTLHDVTTIALQLAATILGPRALTGRFAVHVDVKTSRLLDAVNPPS